MLDPPSALRRVDAFHLGYLPHQVRAHFEALDLAELAGAGAAGELAARTAALRDALPGRGPGIVSCLWQIDAILGDRLRVQPPASPRTGAEGDAWAQAVNAALAAAATAEELRATAERAARAGAAEEVVASARRLFTLWAAAPTHAGLAARAEGLRGALKLAVAAPAPASDCPSERRADADIDRELAGALGAAARPPTDEVAGELAQIQLRLGAAARALEAAAWGTPRAAVRAWHEGRLSGGELMRRLAEHPRWSVPCRLDAGGRPAPRILAFDRRVLMAFSDAQALAERPDFLRGDDPAELTATVPGTALLGWLPDDGVDLLVLDATGDPQAPLTINYPRERHAALRQAALEAAVELAATDWSRLDLAPLRAHRFCILVDGDVVRNPLAPDGYGRPRAAVFTTEAALDAHLERASAEQAPGLAACKRRLLPGHALFPALAKLPVVGFVMNPSGPGRTRPFDKRTLDLLAAPAPSA